MSTFCSQSDPQNACLTDLWVTLVPICFVALLALFRALSLIPLPSPLKWLLSQLKPFLPLQEAEELIAMQTNGRIPDTSSVHAAPREYTWPIKIVVGVAILQICTRLALGIRTLILSKSETNTTSLISIIPWLYTLLHPTLLNPKPVTVPFPLFYLALIQLVGGIVTLGQPFYDSYVALSPHPGQLTIALLALNSASELTVIVALLSMPIGVPGVIIDANEIGINISPEDYTALWKWITFDWVRPIVAKGTGQTLNESDVWQLSPSLRSHSVFTRFGEIKRSTLLRRIWAANSSDMLLDIGLTALAAFLNYAGPFFLNRILKALEAASLPYPRKETLANAYIFAVLAFVASILKSQADVHHLWYGRRASTRLRSELTCSIYEKSLKRKDLSGVVSADRDKEDKDEAKKGKKKSGDKLQTGADVGKITQLMSGDAVKVATTVTGLYNLYAAPFEIILGTAFLYNLLGVSAFAGIVVIIIASPINTMLAKRTFKIQKSILAARDKRMSVLNELISAIKFIKFFAWEEKWMGRAMDARNHEIGWLIKARLNGLMYQLLWACVPVLVAISAFATYVLLGNELTVSVAFTSIALFQMLRFPLNVIPGSIVNIIQTGVALERVAAFLREPEVEDFVSSLKREGPIPAPTLVDITDEPAPLGIRNATFRWNVSEQHSSKAFNKGKQDTKPTTIDDEVAELPEEVRFELKNIDVTFPSGKLTIVTGPTASGKTALLMALLGEMTMTPESNAGGGNVLLDKDPLKLTSTGLRQHLSYASQTPWLQHLSIRENILFGSPLDPQRYDDVLECCALKPDLAVFEDGDETEIGVMGVNLSGGQKARVALARAVYASTQYVLLDDPLSAVDSHTARHLMDKLFMGPLLRGRTVILVTHHVHLALPVAGYVVSMLEGHVEHQGTVEELRKRGHLAEITSTETAALAVEKEKTIDEAENMTADPAVKEADATETVKSKPRKLVEDEQRQQGAVKWTVYKTYLRASSYWTWAILLCLVFFNQGSTVIEKLWLKVWGESYAAFDGLAPHFTSYDLATSISGDTEVIFNPQVIPDFNIMNDTGSIQWLHNPSPYDHPLYYVGIYSAIGFAAVLVSLTSSAVQITGGLRASRLLFKQLLMTVVRATVRFHDTTPAGRMLNRFSKDIGVIDTQLASSLQRVNTTLATFFASLLIVSVIQPLFLGPAAIIGYVYIRIGFGYLESGRDLRRMESTSRSPIYSKFTELLNGVVTVRAFSQERRFLSGFFTKFDVPQQMFYFFWMTNRWLLLNYDLLSCISDSILEMIPLGGFSVFITMLMALSVQMSAGLGGLMITSAMSFTQSIYWTCRVWTTLELDLNAVERIVEYLEIPQEPAARIESSTPPAYWPSSTTKNPMIEFRNTVIKYSPDLPAVVKGVSIRLYPRERVGLIGRTGSGKSTLAMSVLRFVEPTEGQILVDGVDITTVGLYDLRGCMTYIPQDATLFSGTIRDNIDPFDEFTDMQCLDALRRVHLLSRSSRNESNTSSETEASASGASTTVVGRDTAQKAGVGLDTKVSAGGTNFSQGQRQLLALARALLRQSSIIIMDEATSSIDFETDAKIQETIREEFSNALLLTIAHRLNTIIDYDKVVVLDAGKVVECDTPYELIRKENGMFRNLCVQSGSFEDLMLATSKRAELGK